MLGKLGVQGQLLRQLVAVAPENGLDVFQSVQAFAVGNTATGIQALTGVLLAQVEQPETEAVGLFGMFPLIQPITDPDQRVGPNVPGPVLKPPRRPLLLFLMAGGHVA